MAGNDDIVAPTDNPDFVQSLQGFASMCESSGRTGGMSPEDCDMVAGKLRDACFVIDELQKLRDGKISLGWKLVHATALAERDAQIERLTRELAEARSDLETAAKDAEHLLPAKVAAERDLAEARAEVERLRELFRTDGEQHAQFVKNLTKEHENRITKYADAFNEMRAEVKRKDAALRRADQFITNGLDELGFIRMPDASTPDPAHETPGIIRAALTAKGGENAEE